MEMWQKQLGTDVLILKSIHRLHSTFVTFGKGYRAVLKSEDQDEEMYSPSLSALCGQQFVFDYTCH